ncbi:MAG: ATP-binding protein [Coprobacillus sp.]
MIKISDVVKDPQIQDMKNESIYALSKEKQIQEFLKAHHLDTSMMEDYWVEFLDFNDDYKTCLQCQSLESCPKDNKGMKKNWAYRDHQVILELESCQYGKEWENKRLLLEKFVVTNVNDNMLLTDLKTLDVVRKGKELSPNGQLALSSILKYIQEPTDQGLFLHGDMGTGKTTLLAGLMNALAKKGKEIGFIHFPTYLIDLKSSFSTGDNEYAMERLMKVDYLLLDGVGEENVTPWSRDEILLTILSYRLLNHLPTFFTSMYGYEDLKKVYIIKKDDKIRANTLTSKMKALSKEIMLDEGQIR